MKKILFLHTNFPAQYRRLVPYLKESGGFDIRAGSEASNPQKIEVPHVRFTQHREARSNIHPALTRTENAILVGQAAYSALHAFKKENWIPDVVCAHSGYGVGLFAKDVFPNAKYLAYHEWYFNGALTNEGQPADPEDHDGLIRGRLANIPFLVDLSAMDLGVTPTRYQCAQFPKAFQPQMRVVHDGVDTDFYTPVNSATVHLAKGGTLTEESEIITYVARGMEPYRGFPQFMEAVSKVQQQNPNVHTIIVGQDRVAYGSRRKDGQTYKEHALKTLDLDMSRIHFPGLVDFETLREIFRISSVHVYLTAPFVLSWSMIEAMSTGCIILGSDTPPVQEVLRDGENGFLVDLLDSDKIAERILDIIKNNASLTEVRKRARETILLNYDAKNTLPCHRQMIVDLL
jgi:glycosyltransferase involved in cell wall biosynthesis